MCPVIRTQMDIQTQNSTHWLWKWISHILCIQDMHNMMQNMIFLIFGFLIGYQNPEIPKAKTMGSMAQDLENERKTVDSLHHLKTS